MTFFVNILSAENPYLKIFCETVLSENCGQFEVHYQSVQLSMGQVGRVGSEQRKLQHHTKHRLMSHVRVQQINCQSHKLGVCCKRHGFSRYLSEVIGQPQPLDLDSPMGEGSGGVQIFPFGKERNLQDMFGKGERTIDSSVTMDFFIMDEFLVHFSYLVEKKKILWRNFLFPVWLVGSFLLHQPF